MADLRLVLHPAEDLLDDFDENKYTLEDTNEENDLQNEESNTNESCIDNDNPEELFTPLARLQSYSISDSVFNRRTITHDLPNILGTLEQNEDFVLAIDSIMHLSEDLEPSVRVELMEQFPYISHYYFNKLHIDDNSEKRVEIYKTAMINILVRYLTDVNNQVRKSCHMTIIDVMECGYLSIEPFQEHVMPVITSLTGEQQTPDDYKTEAVALGCKICRILGNQFTVKYFLPIFLSACEDHTLFHIRKVCASNITGLCEVLTLDVIKDKLLPRFQGLCTDNVWGVRKSCAECFPEFAKYFTDGVLSDVLSPIFSDLLSDQSRWVRIAAFESLGPFISAFADSSNANLGSFSGKHLGQEYGNKDNPFNSFNYWRDPLLDGLESEFDSILNVDADNKMDHIEKNSTESISIKSESFENKSQIGTNGFQILDEADTEKHSIPTVCSTEEDNQDAKEEETETNVARVWNYNEKVKLIYSEQVEELESEEEICTTENKSEENEQDQPHSSTDDDVGRVWNYAENSNSIYTDMNEPHHYPGSYESFDYGASSYPDSGFDYRIFGSMQDISFTRDEDMYDHSNIRSSTKTQDVIPQALLDNFLSMTDPLRRQTVDGEIAKHCAYSLPGVAYTLGRDNWHCLKDAYQKLAGDVQEKVRHTIASSIHELAKILGEELTTSDLVPVFNSFLKDADEVRIGVVRHLSEFLELLDVNTRSMYLYELTDFLNIENNKNWRFRSELSQQLARITELYTAEEISTFICPVALRLTSDNVVVVQRDAVDLIVTLLKKLLSAIDESESDQSNIAVKHFENFVEQIATHLAKSAKWKDRRLYCNLCEALVTNEFQLPVEVIFQYFVPHLKKLSEDKIVNVRICCARALRATFNNSYSTLDKNSVAVLSILEKMQTDSDRDVKAFSAVNCVKCSATDKINDDIVSSEE